VLLENDEIQIIGAERGGLSFSALSHLYPNTIFDGWLGVAARE